VREQLEWERECGYMREEYRMGYGRDERGRRSPPLSSSRMGPGPGLGLGVVCGAWWGIGGTIGGMFRLRVRVEVRRCLRRGGSESRT